MSIFKKQRFFFSSYRADLSQVLRSKYILDDYYAPGPMLSVIKIVSGLKEFAHRQSKIHTSPRYTAIQSRWDSLCVPWEKPVAKVGVRSQ